MPEPAAFDIELERPTSSSDDYKLLIEQLEKKSEYLSRVLEEKLVVVTASLKTLKQNVLKEKDLLRNEIKETVQLERKLSELNLQNHSKNQTQIQNGIVQAAYKQQLLEAEEMCNSEMLKIRKSLECLAPLTALVNEWGSETETDDGEVNETCSGEDLTVR